MRIISITSLTYTLNFYTLLPWHSWSERLHTLSVRLYVLYLLAPWTNYLKKTCASQSLSKLIVLVATYVGTDRRTERWTDKLLCGGSFAHKNWTFDGVKELVSYRNASAIQNCWRSFRETVRNKFASKGTLYFLFFLHLSNGILNELNRTRQ